MDLSRVRVIRRRSIAIGTTLVALMPIGALVWLRSSHHESGLQHQIAELVAAVGPNRLFEPRLAGGFAYAPPSPPLRAAKSPGAGAPDLRIAVAKIEKVALEQRTPRALAALGVANLVSGRAAEAVESLESAVRDDPSDPIAWNDLAAAYLVRADHGRRPEDLVRALAAADRVTRAAPYLKEAWFNRALAMEDVGGLRRQARYAWQAYSRIDGESGWSVEARRHLDSLSGTPVQTWQQLKPILIRSSARGEQQAIVEIARLFPVRTRDYLFDELLPAWAAAKQERTREKAADALHAARLVADAVVDATTDPMANDIVGLIESASRRARRLDDVVRGILTFGRARRLAADNQIELSQSLFQNAADTLERIGNPLFAEALNNRAAGPILTGRYQEAASAIDKLTVFAERHHYALLIARVRWAQGLIALARADLGQSLVEYRAALRAYQAAGEREYAIRVRNVLAENLRLLGQLRESWDEQREALVMLDQIADVSGREAILGSAANACLRAELPNAALAFFDDMVEEAEQSGRPQQIVGARLRRARGSWRLGRTEEAVHDLETAKASLSRIPDAVAARTQELDVLAQEGEVFQKERPDRAIQALDLAIDAFRARGVPRRLPNLLLTRGRAHLSQGAFDAAARDFLAGIDLFEEAHGRIAENDVRLSHFDEAWDLFAEMIAVQAGPKRRPDLALNFAERARARTLAEAVTRSTTPSSSPDVFDVRLRAPLAGMAVVCYLSLPDHLLAWVLTDARADFFDLTVTRNQIARLIEAYQANVIRKAGAAVVDADAVRLYDAVVKPLSSSLAGIRNVVFVPDGPLHALAFAALKNPETHRYFVEDHAVGVAPSFTLLLESVDRTRAMPSAVSDVLVVGDPQLDRATAGDLPDLIEAKAEARDVAALYPRALLLTGEAASKQRFLRRLNDYAVVHFAGHAIQNAEFPWLSRLLLAADPGTAGSGTLFAYELAALRLQRVRLVVLGACATAAGPALRGEGVLNLARPFLAAGAPSVVATLWDVDDHGGRRLLTAFHRYVRAGQSPILALQTAQLELLKSGDTTLQGPEVWANFVLIGAPGVTVPPHEARLSHN